MNNKKQNQIILPADGLKKSELYRLLKRAKEDDVDWEDGKIWGLVYYAGKEHNELLANAYKMFLCENGLGSDAFPSLKKLEAEVVSILLSILGGDEDTVGTMTSGGTESILLAVKTCRDFFKERNPSSNNPEMIIPSTAHPAFLKASHYFNVKPVVIPVGSDYRANVKSIEQACNKKTIMIVASAPSFPQGVVDPIRDLGKLALSLDLWLHIDACLGGLFLPFLKKMHYQVPEFDFRVPGVTSISADLHKYGYAAKGASAILYKKRKYRRYQFFVNTDWPGGLYASPTMLGTRPGGAIAAAWIALMSLGEKGYLNKVRKTMEGTEIIISRIKGISDLKIVGKPDMSVFSFTFNNGNIFSVANRMEAKGWRMNRQKNPDSLHMIVTINHLKVIDTFIKDLEVSVNEERTNPLDIARDQHVILYGRESGDQKENDMKEYLIRKLEENFIL